MYISLYIHIYRNIRLPCTQLQLLSSSKTESDGRDGVKIKDYLELFTRAPEKKVC